ncbi:MAG: hypothetical protein ABFE08_11695, partial [Armatimonadia bacterium]
MTRTCHRLCLLCLALLLLAMLPGQAQDQEQLDDLKALFEKDPAAGFVEAERLFEKPKREGDLEGMLAVLGLVARWSSSCCYTLPCTIMAEVTLPLAVARGNWKAVGDIRWAQALMGSAGRGLLRIRLLDQMATEAYARAGQEPAGFTAWKAEIEPAMARLHDLTASQLASIGELPADIRPAFQDFVDAFDKAEETRACALAGELLPAGEGTAFWVRNRIVAWICARMPLPGAERLLPQLRQYILDANSDAEAAELIGHVMLGCAKAWSGRRDAYVDTYDWCVRRLHALDVPARVQDAQFLPVKYVRFHQGQMSDQVVRALLDIPENPQDPPARWFSVARYLMHASIAPDLRRRLVCEQLRYYLWAVQNGQSDVMEVVDGGFPGWLVAQTAPEADRATRCLETGYQLAEYAPEFPTAASRSRLATEAAAYFTKAGRADLAAEATELARSFAADDPKLRLQVALAAAQSAASAGKWEEVIKGLEPVVSGAPPSVAAVQGALLIRQAQLSLGKADEATAWLGKAGEILGQARVPASERVAYLMDIVGLTRDKAKRLALLKQADAAAGEAELEPLREKVSQQLAELALAAGDLDTAETALLDIIDR